MSKEKQKYLLAIKRGNNDYLLLEWNLTSFYDNEDMTSLEGIDKFTKKITKTDLLLEILKLNIIDLNERFNNFTIIYLVNGKYHELKEGAIFKDDTSILTEDLLIDFIYSNSDNKKLMNMIYNLLVPKVDDQEFTKFKYIIKNIDFFKQKGENGLKASLSIFKNIKYENKRSILIKISNRIIVNSDNTFSSKKN